MKVLWKVRRTTSKKAMTEDGRIHVALGVSGGIGAYKAAGIVRALRNGGAAVTVLMTANATEFITPLTLQTLSGNRVLLKQFDGVSREWDVEHVSLAKRATCLLVAPATANIIMQQRQVTSAGNIIMQPQQATAAWHNRRGRQPATTMGINNVNGNRQHQQPANNNHVQSSTTRKCSMGQHQATATGNNMQQQQQQQRAPAGNTTNKQHYHATPSCTINKHQQTPTT